MIHVVYTAKVNAESFISRLDDHLKIKKGDCLYIPPIEVCDDTCFLQPMNPISLEIFLKKNHKEPKWVLVNSALSLWSIIRVFKKHYVDYKLFDVDSDWLEIRGGRGMGDILIGEYLLSDVTNSNYEDESFVRAISSIGFSYWGYGSVFELRDMLNEICKQVPDVKVYDLFKRSGNEKE